MARAVNFGTLRSLTLLRCRGWYVFLVWAIELKLPIRLKTFGIHIIDDAPYGSNRIIIEAFLSSFKGLEDLFIDEPERQGLLLYWDDVACHQPALKKFVHQQRTWPSDRSAFSSARVVPRLPLLNLEMLQLQRGPFATQLRDLDLEFVGLPCRPMLLVPVLSLYTRKTSLKVLHIRQPAPVRSGVQPCWALHDRFVDRHSGLELRSTPSEINNVISGCRDEIAAASLFRSGLRSEFRDFAEWVFGPHGIDSLRFLVFGDYSFGGRKCDNRLILCRDPMPVKKSNFRISPEATRTYIISTSTATRCGRAPHMHFLMVSLGYNDNIVYRVVAFLRVLVDRSEGLFWNHSYRTAFEASNSRQNVLR